MRLPGIPTLRSCGAADVWTASTFMPACAAAVLDALTDPMMIADWAPISFDVEELDGDRLHAGSHARVNGSIGGVGATFSVEVVRADDQGLELLARGPVVLDVLYRFIERGDGVLKASVALRAQGGVTGQLMRVATAALLSGGALAGALERLASGVAEECEGELLAA